MLVLSSPPQPRQHQWQSAWHVWSVHTMKKTKIHIQKRHNNVGNTLHRLVAKSYWLWTFLDIFGRRFFLRSWLCECLHRLEGRHGLLHHLLTTPGEEENGWKRKMDGKMKLMAGGCEENGWGEWVDECVLRMWGCVGSKIKVLWKCAVGHWLRCDERMQRFVTVTVAVTRSSW